MKVPIFKCLVQLRKALSHSSSSGPKMDSPLDQDLMLNYRIDNLKISSFLTIEKVAKSDIGNYSCLAKNGVASDSQSVLLQVKGLFQNLSILVISSEE